VQSKNCGLSTGSKVVDLSGSNLSVPFCMCAISYSIRLGQEFSLSVTFVYCLQLVTSFN